MVHALSVTGIAFGLHTIWENFQCPLFFRHGSAPSLATTMLLATLGDVVMTWVVQLVVAVASGRWLWVAGRWRRLDWTLMGGAAIAMSVSVEALALSRGWWAYTDAAPLVPGTRISVVPVAQLLLLFPLTFWLTRQILIRVRVTGEESAANGSRIQLDERGKGVTYP